MYIEGQLETRKYTIVAMEGENDTIFFHDLM